MAMGTISFCQWWAHWRPSEAHFMASAGPIRGHRHHILEPVVGPFKAISTKIMASRGPIQGHQQHMQWPWMGPFKAISSICNGHGWAHSKPLAADFGASGGPD